jgi:hypothetical protein
MCLKVIWNEKAMQRKGSDSSLDVDMSSLIQQGSRKSTSPVVSSEHLPVFHQRLMEIVNESIARDNQNDRLCLRFSLEAENRWIEFYNKVESDMHCSAP